MLHFVQKGKGIERRIECIKPKGKSFAERRFDLINKSNAIELQTLVLLYRYPLN